MSDRYQTLEDLRNELRDLSQSLNKELLDLVNDNYHAFLSLGSTLHGGEDRVQEVRLGLLSFQRDLTSVRDNVEERRKNAASLIEEKRTLMKHMQVGKALLDIAEQIEDLEASLMIGAPGNGEMNGQPNDFSDDSDEDGEDDALPIRRLERHVEQYLILKLLLQRQNPSQPYIASQSERITRIQSTLALDLEGALKQFKSVQEDEPNAVPTKFRLEKLLNYVNEKEIPKITP